MGAGSRRKRVPYAEEFGHVPRSTPVSLIFGDGSLIAPVDLALPRFSNSRRVRVTAAASALKQHRH